MNRLTCNVRKCNHNFFGICDMNKVNISEGINNNISENNCISFEKNRISKIVKRLGNIDLYTDRLKFVEYGDFSIKLPDIECNVIECEYNENKSCISKTVMINGFRATSCNGTNCLTYKKNLNEINGKKIQI
ncbi:DUF1540 domain-containing protein [Clostridium sp.]|uniref:DUF1540 domain-containing protein n=1 Tax=Clostridium sp. TaxID=1506 RepID=UPI003F3D6E54